MGKASRIICGDPPPAPDDHFYMRLRGSWLRRGCGDTQGRETNKGNDTMILRTSPPSPFGRKVKIAADILGLSDRIEVITADTTDASDPLRQQNPLGKIPVLILDSGETYYDSRVIVEYLDHLAGGGKILPQGEARFPVLRLQALADGIMDANILRIYEGRWRDPSRHEEKWVAYQTAKVDRALDYAESIADSFAGKIDAGTISLACALGHMDLRFPDSWQGGRPKLVAFMEAFEAKVPSFAKTRVTA